MARRDDVRLRDQLNREAVALRARPDLYEDPDHDVFVPDYTAARAKKRLWLTFDDGPHPQHTRAILAALAGAGCSATFFVQGMNAIRHRPVLEEIVAAGHRIGNHAYSHLNLATLPERKVREEIVRTDELIRDLIEGPKLFRPPFGSDNEIVDAVAAELGYSSVGWTIDPEDWKPEHKPSLWVEIGLAQVPTRPSGTVLLHDIHASTAANLGGFLGRLGALASIQPAATLGA